MAYVIDEQGEKRIVAGDVGGDGPGLWDEIGRLLERTALERAARFDWTDPGEWPMLYEGHGAFRGEAWTSATAVAFIEGIERNLRKVEKRNPTAASKRLYARIFGGHYSEDPPPFSSYIKF